MADQTVQYSNATFNLATHERFEDSPELVLFLHGLGCSKESFEAAFSSKYLAGLSLCSLDVLGHGESEKPEDFSYSLEEQAAIAIGLVNQMPYDRLSIVGHSMGGGIGLLMAKELNPDIFIGVEGLLADGAYSKKIVSFEQDEFVNNQYDLFARQLTVSSQPAMRQWAEWYSQASPLAVYRSAQSMVSWATSGKLFDILNNLDRKAYVYSDSGAIDSLRPHFTDVDTYRIEQSGHFIMQDNPSAFCKRIGQLISRRTAT